MGQMMRLRKHTSRYCVVGFVVAIVPLVLRLLALKLLALLDLSKSLLLLSFPLFTLLNCLSIFVFVNFHFIFLILILMIAGGLRCLILCLPKSSLVVGVDLLCRDVVRGKKVCQSGLSASNECQMADKW